jgi:lipoyl(octanoyl) transferase
MSVMQNRNIIFQDLGTVDFGQCWDYQEKLFSGIVEQKIRNRELPDELKTPTQNYLLFVEHPHVYTLGKSGKHQHLLISEEELKKKNATFHRINRGGDITYHGPGQLVGYPILDLDNFFTDIHKYLRLLEEAIILTLEEYGLKGGRRKGETGVWLDAEHPSKARKICAMGVRCSRWVTMHGWAFNVNSDLSYFGHIIPCGISDKGVTSLQQEMDEVIDPAGVKSILRKHFAAQFDATLSEGEELLLSRGHSHSGSD